MPATKNAAPLVLIVDDTAENISVLHSFLKKDGYSFAVAENSREVFSILSAVVPDIILLDIMLPGSDGFEVLRRLKAEKRWAEIPVILVSARASVADRIRGLQDGAVDYIVKPFDGAEVAMRVKTQLALKQALERERNLVRQLEEALERVKLLSGIIPICSQCKKIRDDHGYWQKLEKYLSEHSDAEFSHGLCPDCLRLLYPDASPDTLREIDELGRRRFEEGKERR